MNTRLVNSVAGVINAALMQNCTAAGIAMALESAQLLMSPETAAELKGLRARVGELELAEGLARAAEAEAQGRATELEAQRAALATRLRKGQTWQRGRNPEQVSQDYVSQDELRAIFGIQLTAPWENEPAPKCRCSEPDADPYACEADDCEGEFSELNPFGGGPVEGVDAKVSKVCGCGWRTSVWHVNDGSAEEELHGHVTRVHGGVYPVGVAQ